MSTRQFRHLPPEPDGDQPGDPLQIPADETPGEGGDASRAESGPASTPGESGYLALLGGLEVDLLGESDSDEDA